MRTEAVETYGRIVRHSSSTVLASDQRRQRSRSSFRIRSTGTAFVSRTAVRARQRDSEQPLYARLAMRTQLGLTICRCTSGLHIQPESTSATSGLYPHFYPSALLLYVLFLSSHPALIPTPPSSAIDHKISPRRKPYSLHTGTYKHYAATRPRVREVQSLPATQSPRCPWAGTLSARMDWLVLRDVELEDPGLG